MKIKDFVYYFLLAFGVTLIVNAIVVYLWNLIRHGKGMFNWETSFFFAIPLGIVLPLLDLKKGNR